MRILLVDDEVELTNPVSRALIREAYAVDMAYDGQQGQELASTGGYDLLILDWMLPGKSGIEICRALRAQGDTTPVLFLTAKDTLDNRVEGLDAGADDYLVKPFELRELLARVRALLRRPPLAVMATTEPQRLQVEDLELDSENQVAYRRGRVIELSDKESVLLGYMMRHPGQLLTHEQLYHEVWGEMQQPSSNVLAAQIRLLRRKIEVEGALIHTVYGKGYRFGQS